MNDKSYSTEFIVFMKNHRAKKDETITHTLMGPLEPDKNYGKGSFSIEGIDYEKFIKLYKRVVGKMDLYVVERPKIVGPMVIDIDFNTTKKDRQYLDKHIECIVSRMNKKIIEYFDVDKEDIKAFVLEKEKPTYDEKKNICKDGFHIIYGLIPINVKMRYLLLEETRDEIIKENGFSDIPFTNTYEKIFDPSVIISNGILMPGSHKEGRTPYELTKIYNWKMKLENIDDYNNDDIVDILTLRKFDDKEEILLNEKYDNEIMINRLENIYNQHHSGKKIENIAIEEKPERIRKSGNKHIDDNDLELVQRLISILSPKRADDYNDWIHVGWALHNVSNKLYDDFVKFSKQCQGKFDETKCRKIWNDSKNYGFTIASIYWWAKMDNKDGFLEIIRERIKDLLIKAESGTHDDIADVVFEMYKDSYKCVDIAGMKWYEYQDNRWVVVDSAYTLQEKIKNELTKELTNYSCLLLNQAGMYEGASSDNIRARASNLLKLVSKLKQTKFKADVLKACARMFYDGKFEEKLNSNLYLIGFDNGVFDLKNKCFRNGTPDDYVSLSTQYDYEAFTDDSPIIIEIKDFFEKVQPKQEMRDFVLTSLASCLDGCIRDQFIYVWTGTGCHVKNTLIRMFDGTSKNIQDIKIGDLLLGDDGRERKVQKLFRGNSVIFQIKTNKNIKFSVNGKHRLALKCFHKPLIIEEYDDVFNKNLYVVYYYEYINAPILMRKQFVVKEKANKFLRKIKRTCIQYDEIIPVETEILFNMKGIEDDWINDFKLVPYDNCNVGDLFTIKKCQKEKQYFGIEIDGNKRYVMDNGYITYNSNGKSASVDLMNKANGDYATTFAITVFTRTQRGSSNATPEIANKCGKRFISVNETEKRETLYTSLMKTLTSGTDKITTRTLYEKPFDYIPQFKMFLLCNMLPNIEDTGDGTWRRICVVPFNSKFVDDNPQGENVYLKDKNLPEKMEKWKKGFMWYLIHHYYYNYVENGLKVPECVLLKTKEYRSDSDKFMAFYNEYIDDKSEKKCDKEYKIVYTLFKSWYRDTYSEKPPNGNEFKKFLTETKNFKIDKGIVKNIALSINDSDNGYI